ncbi:MAG: bifunctional folylpolyglutamate synthase/dihydrofolate synthase [Chthoniobacterales bacterium]
MRSGLPAVKEDAVWQRRPTISTAAAPPPVLCFDIAVSHPSSNYVENLAWLYGLQRFGIKLGLENMHRLIAELGLASKLPRRVIHVAGTNGKGSVCAMIDAICRTQDLKTGLFTSPHLVSFRERIQVNGQLISEEDAGAGLGLIRQTVADWDPHPTFFEVTTALALQHFIDADVDVAILETGLGGRLDATNAIGSTVAVITPIGMDHQKWLGDTIERIASEKAGIIKPDGPVISSPQSAAAEEVLRKRAQECKAPIEFVRESYAQGPVGLRGAHQRQNAAVAIAAIRGAGIYVGEAAIARGLVSVQWPARFQRWDDQIIIDGAHNVAAAQVLAKTWREVFDSQRASVMLAILADKDVAGICEALAPIASTFLLPPIRSERAFQPEELAKVLSSVTREIPRELTSSIGEALESARRKPSPILITGSLHFAGDALAFLQGRPSAFEECNQ